MADDSERQYLTINLAPVLTLWRASAAKRLGFKRDEALILGKGGRTVRVVNNTYFSIRDV